MNKNQKRKLNKKDSSRVLCVLNVIDRKKEAKAKENSRDWLLYLNDKLKLKYRSMLDKLLLLPNYLDNKNYIAVSSKLNFLQAQAIRLYYYEQPDYWDLIVRNQDLLNSSDEIYNLYRKQ